LDVDRLFVILGAGASHDGATDTFVSQANRRPPLVSSLFHHDYFGILDDYPLAQDVAADLGPGGLAATSIEQFIRERYQGSTHLPSKRKFNAIPPYLQELLWQCSRSFARSPDNYTRLISEVLELPETVFVTLNYDTLLDERLSIYSPLQTLDHYIAHREPQWSLVKLHGSVNWGRALRGPASFSFHEPPPEVQVDSEIVLTASPKAGLAELRAQGTQTYFPALSVPVGQEDELVCPPAHVDFLSESLRTAQGLHLLVIGYSAYDQEVLRLIRDSGTTVASLMVVNRGEDACRDVLDRLRHALGFNLPDVPHNYDSRGFTDFTLEGLRPYVDGLRP